MVVLTKPQKRMLDFVRKDPGCRPAVYASMMWPDSAAHQNARNAHKVLWRLADKGLVEQDGGCWSPAERGKNG